jgi:hypothetical protein
VDLFPLERTVAPGAILALSTRIDRDAAIAAFGSGVTGAARRLTHGPLRSVATISVPFRLHDVTIRRGREIERMVLGLDAVAGTLDLYRFDQAPLSSVVRARTRNDLEPVLSATAAHGIVAARVNRMLYERVGFFAIGHRDPEVRPIAQVLYIPYWVGFFGRREAASLVAMDAVRRQIEGVKMRGLMERWLRDSPAA